jgi:hypothetical protein
VSCTSASQEKLAGFEAATFSSVSAAMFEILAKSSRESLPNVNPSRGIDTLTIGPQEA